LGQQYPKRALSGLTVGRTHRFFTGTPTVPFGFGLSYTNFSYKVAAAPREAVTLDTVHALLSPFTKRPFPPQHVTDRAGAVVQHTITVANTGSVDADDVVLGFIKPPGAGYLILYIACYLSSPEPEKND
jgi:beta-D-xylosidase 4